MLLECSSTVECGTTFTCYEHPSKAGKPYAVMRWA